MSSHSYIKNKLNNDIYININGDFKKRSDAKISVFDSGFLLGDGIWEGIRLHKGVLLHIDKHLNRLFESANGLSINIKLTKTEIIDEIERTLSKNSMNSDVHIRLIISRGDKITPYQNPNANVGPINFVIIPEFKKVDEKIYNDGVRIGRVPNIRPNEKILDPRFNTLSKLNCILASIEANKMGFDEGIMNDINGNISTCNSTNLFFILDNEVWTSTGRYCLNGITRGEIIDVCRKNKISIFEQDFTFADIKNCQEAFVTGTFSGVIPVSYIEDKKLNSTNHNSITNTIKTLYFEDIESNCK